MNAPAVTRFADSASFAAAAAKGVIGAVAGLMREKASPVLAVPGGTTARTVLPLLAAAEIRWERLIITLTDERWIPPDHVDSNEGLVRQLLGHRARVIGFYTGDLIPRLPSDPGQIPRPDVILLGMGEDGHIASLFPFDPANHSIGPFAVVARSDYARVTITPPVLKAACRTILAIAGPLKDAILKSALAAESTMEFPVCHVLHDRTTVMVGP